MVDELDKLLQVYDEEFGIKLECPDIDKILGLEPLQLKPYVWKPYYLKAEEYLQSKLKNALYELQKTQTTGLIIGECLFREYQNKYILITSTKEINKKNPNGEKFTHLIITIYDGNTNYLKHIKRRLIQVRQKNGAFYYRKIKVSINEFPEYLKEKLDKMGLFNNRGSHQQQIYTSRLLPAINLINNDLVLTPDYEGHHAFFDTQQEILSAHSLLLTNRKKHNKIFHPENLKYSNKSTLTIAYGTLFTSMLKMKYFRNKQKKYNANIHANIYDLLKLTFIDNLGEAEVRTRLAELHPKNKLSSNTIHTLIKHYTQYKLVLTPSNIDNIRDIEKW